MPRRWIALAVLVLVLPAVTPARATHAFRERRCDPVCNVRVTTTQGPANEVTVAVNPTDPQNLIAGAKDYTYGPGTGCGSITVWAGLYRSLDGGRTWQNQLLDPATVPGNSPCVTDPVLTFAPDGTAYYVGLGIGRSNVLFVHRSTDKGATWQYRGTVATGGPDKQWAAVDPSTGELWVAWIDLTGGNVVRVAASSDGGATWRRVPFGVSGSLVLNQGPIIAVGTPLPGAPAPVYVTWRDLATGIIHFAASTDGGAIWRPGPPAAVSASATDFARAGRGYRYFGLPAMAVDPTPGSRLVYVAYTDLSQSTGEVRVVHSHDGGLTWGPPIPVDVDPARALSDEFMPAIAMGPGGVPHVVYYTNEYDTTGRRRLDVKYAYGGHGDLFDPPVRLTDVSSDPSLSRHQSGAEFIGDYIGIAATADEAHAIWADTRNGAADAYLATVKRN